MNRTPMLFAALLLALCAARPTTAADQTVSVVAIGEVEVRPDTVVIRGTLSESSEKIKDAVTAFRDTQRRAMASIDALQIEGLSVTTGSLSLVMGGEMDFDGEGVPAGALTISQSVTLKVTGLGEMEEQAVVDLVVQLLDAARESGVSLSQVDQSDLLAMQMGVGSTGSAVARFMISDPEAALRNATRDAMDRARADAGFLAELAGGKVGRVVSVSDATAPANEEGPSNIYEVIYGLSMDGGDPFSSDALEPIKVVRAVRVGFELVYE